MKAIVCRAFGSHDGLVVDEVAAPVPAPDQVLVRIHAASLNPADNHVLGMPRVVRWFARSMVPARRIPGADFAGIVQDAGESVDAFSKGDRVFGDLSGSGWGAFAQYATVPASTLARMPQNAGFEEAAAVPMAGVTALQGLRDVGRLRPGRQVAVNGASGGVGHLAVQVAKALGAHVTGVCSTRNVDFVRKLGADQVVDYTKADFTEASKAYDMILDTAAHRPLSQYMPAIKDGGSYVLVGGSAKAWMHASIRGRKQAKADKPRIVAVSSKPTASDLDWLATRMQQGTIAAFVDSIVSLPEVPKALARLKAGHARGKTVVRL